LVKAPPTHHFAAPAFPLTVWSWHPNQAAKKAAQLMDDAAIKEREITDEDDGLR
jgi:hypothetical protein